MTNRLKIIDYFDALVDEVDLKAEKLLTNYSSALNRRKSSTNEGQSVEQLINERRTSFIDTIQNIKNHNLTCLDKKCDQANNEEAIFDKYCFILDKHDINIPEADHFLNCDSIDIKETFGYLVVLEDGAVSGRKLELFKEIVFPRNSHEYYTCEELDQTSKNKFLRKLDDINSYILESNIFNAKLLTVLKHTKFELRAFKNIPADFIIRTNQSQLFNVERILFNNPQYLFTIKQEAIELFFNSPVTIVVQMFERDEMEEIFSNNDFSEHDDIVCELKSSLEWYETKLKVEKIDVNLKLYHLIDLDELSSVKNWHKISIEKSFIRFGKIFVNKNNEENVFITSMYNQLDKLEELNLDGHSRGTIDSDALKGLWNLKKLKMSEMTINSMKYMRDLSNLIELNLCQTRVIKIEDGSFSNLPNLKTFIMDDCNEVTIGEFLFADLINLETLRISASKSIHSKAFAPLKNLTSLTLNAKLVKTIDADLFNELSRLKILRLSNVHSFKFDSIKRLLNLEELDLTNVKIERIVVGDLSVFPRFRKLKLESNGFQFFDPRSLHGMLNLRELELKVNDLTNLDSVTFAGLRNLTRLILSENNIKVIKPGTFDDLNNLNELTIRENRLQFIPENLFHKLANLRTLNLSSNQITHVNENAFRGLENLHILELPSNQFTKLAPNMFGCLRGLLWLDLSKNLIKSVGRSAFYGLTSLANLNLTDNKLTRIASKTFESLASLLDLDLSRCDINEIEAGSFIGLKNLNRLLLNNTSISRLVENTFQGLDKVAQLHLTFNQLESLDQHQFDHMPMLREVTFFNNRIARIHPNAFDSLSNLKSLSLSHNQLVKLNGAMFKKLSNLTELQVRSNRITKIDSHTFDSLVNLRRLYLDQNSISIIDDGAFGKLKKLTHLVLRNNPLRLTDGSLFKQLELLEHLCIDPNLRDKLIYDRTITSLNYLNSNFFNNFYE